jgi:hypothetical protein
VAASYHRRKISKSINESESENGISEKKAAALIGCHGSSAISQRSSENEIMASAESEEIS